LVEIAHLKCQTLRKLLLLVANVFASQFFVAHKFYTKLFSIFSPSQWFEFDNCKCDVLHEINVGRSWKTRFAKGSHRKKGYWDK
jgi:hypothetical protein